MESSTGSQPGECQGPRGCHPGQSDGFPSDWWILVTVHCYRFLLVLRGGSGLGEEGGDDGEGGEDSEDGSQGKDCKYFCNLKGGQWEESEGKVDEGRREDERHCKFVKLAGGSKQGQGLRHRRCVCRLQGTHGKEEEEHPCPTWNCFVGGGHQGEGMSLFVGFRAYKFANSFS